MSPLDLIVMPNDVLKGWKKTSLEPEDDRDYLFTKNGMKFLLSEIPEFPGKPIARGENWRHRREQKDEFMSETLTETFSLTSLEGPSATFDAKPEIILAVLPVPARNGAEPVPPKQDFSLVSAEVEKQLGESKMIFDLADGRLVTFSRRQRYEVKYVYGAKAGTEPAQTIKLATAIEFEMKLLATPGRR